MSKNGFSSSQPDSIRGRRRSCPGDRCRDLWLVHGRHRGKRDDRRRQWQRLAELEGDSEDSWDHFSIDMVSHEIGHIVETANNSVEESPAFEMWKDSKWIEFYQYDLYMALGLRNDARRINREVVQAGR